MARTDEHGITVTPESEMRKGPSVSGGVMSYGSKREQAKDFKQKVVDQLPEPTKANAVRYIPPLATLAVPGAGWAAEGLVTGGSELLAQAIEHYEETGEWDWPDKEGMGEAGLATLLPGAFRTLGTGARLARDRAKKTGFSLLDKMFSTAPEAITPDGAITQEILERGGKHASSKTLASGKDTPSMLEDILRSSMFGRKHWTQMDTANEDFVLKLLKNYYSQQRGIVPPSVHGERLAKLLVGNRHLYRETGKATGELGYARGVRTVFYDVARDVAEEKGLRYEAGQISKFLLDNQTHPSYKDLLGVIGDVMQKAVKQGDESFEKALQAQVANIKDPEQAASYVRRIKAAVGSDPEEGTMPFGSLIDIRTLLNDVAYDKNADPALKGLAERLLKRVVNPAMNEFKDADPALTRALDTADAFLGKSKELLDNKIIKGVYEELSMSPDAVFEHVSKGGQPSLGGLGNTDALSKYKALESAFTEGTQTGLNRAQFEHSVRKPLQTGLLRSATKKGVFDGRQLAGMFQEGNEYVTELFGEEAREEIYKLGIALGELQHMPGSASIMMQLSQARAIMGGLRTVSTLGAAGVGGGVGYAAGDTQGAAIGAVTGGTVLFVSPVILSKLLTNPRTVKTIREGLEAGTQSSKFWDGVRLLTAINVSEKTELQDVQKLGQEAYDFYTRNFEIPEPRPTPIGGMLGARGGEL